MELRFPQDIRKAKASNSWLNRPTVKKVEVNLNLDESRIEQIADRIQTLFNDGGYLWAALAFAFSFSVLLLGCNFLNNEITWIVLGISAGISTLLAITVRLYSLYISYLKLEAELLSLEELIDHELHGQLLMTYDPDEYYHSLTAT